VTHKGYYDTCFLLSALLAVEFLRLVGKLWYDGLALVAAGSALYFLIARVWFRAGTINA
jgi:hypothetical protein